MVKLNPHFGKLANYYFFPEIEKKVSAFKEQHPRASLINLGIGDVTQPLPPHLLAALCTASQEMGDPQTFRGYGPSAGYPFLRESIAYGEYRHLGISANEIFVSDGAKCDLGNIQELFAVDNLVALPDPTYPVYIDTNVMAGRTRGCLEAGRYEGIHYIPCSEEHGFQPLPPSMSCDLIYLCSPNNPTGIALSRSILRQWVDYALEHRSIILFDGAYEAFITSEDCPRSIYELDGAKEVAIEIRSFSKTAGFTGLRCSYTVVPKELSISHGENTISLHSLWRRRHDTKFGGVPYPVQRCAAAIYSSSGKKEVDELLQLYRDRARFLLEGLKKLGFVVYGGKDAPYLWCKTPRSLTSWQFFDQLLEQAHIISAPGRGFGLLGEGFVRLSAFAEPTALAESLLRFKRM